MDKTKIVKMDEKSLAKLERKLSAIEKQLIGELYLLESMNDIIAYVQTYVSNYLPVLFYAVKNFERDQFAKLINSSILIDRLFSVKMNKIVRFQVSTGVRDFVEVNKIEDKDSVSSLFNSLNTIQKANLSSSLLFMFSLLRGALFSLYCDNKMYLNYGIGWNNLLLHYVENPHMIFTLSNKDIKLAEQQLDFIESDLSKEGGELEKEINATLIQNGICTEEECSEITKYFIGQKYEWLKSKSLISYCKFLKTNEEKHLDNSIKYAETIISSLESEDTEYHSFSFRRKLTFPGPSSNIKDIIGDLQQYSRIIKLLNYAAYFETTEKRFVIIFPTTINFYFNHQIVNEKKQSILEDENFILLMHNQECAGIIKNLQAIVKPSQSLYYYLTEDYLSTLLDFQERGLSNKFIYGQLKKSKTGDVLIIEFENKVDKSKAFSNVLGISVLSTFNFFAEAKGFPKIPEYVTTTIPLVTEIVINALYKGDFEKVMQELQDEEEDDTDFLGFDIKDEYQSITELEERIENLEESSLDMANILNLDGLRNVLEVNNKVISLIKSSKSLDEINNELKKLYLESTEQEDS